MLDFYGFVKGNKIFRQFKVNELLFTAYDCPIETDRLDYWTRQNYLFYVVVGGLKWKTQQTKRLEYGRFLLETTDMNIGEITLESGFENNSHFIKCFRETYGQPPLHFRKLMVEGG